MEIVTEMEQMAAADLPLSEEIRAGARALLEQPGPRVLSSEEAGRLGRYFWELADQVRRLECSVRELAAEIVEEGKLPPSVIRIPGLGRVS